MLFITLLSVICCDPPPRLVSCYHVLVSPTIVKQQQHFRAQLLININLDYYKIPPAHRQAVFGGIIYFYATLAAECGT